MVTTKKTWSILSLMFIGLLIFTLTSIALLAVLGDEVAEVVEIGWAVPNYMQVYFVLRETWWDNTGNEFTGEATALLFGAACIPVGVDLISRSIILVAPFGESVKGFVRRINNVQRRHLMPLHTWLSSLALGIGILHLILSSCVANPLPELGLILSGTLVATGLLFKWKAVPTTFRKALYQFHTSLIVSGILLVILFTGHALMDLD